VFTYADVYINVYIHITHTYTYVHTHTFTLDGHINIYECAYANTFIPTQLYNEFMKYIFVYRDAERV
jgi:hypothetical protein